MGVIVIDPGIHNIWVLEKMLDFVELRAESLEVSDSAVGID